MQDDLEFMTVEQFDECVRSSQEKDACYHKVKSRYSKITKAADYIEVPQIGAKNWGNKTKKEEVDRMSEQTAP